MSKKGILKTLGSYAASLLPARRINPGELQTLSVIVARAQLASQMGLQYGGDRDVYRALGYKASSEITYTDYYNYYSRLDIAAAVINRPIDATWRGGFELLESDDDNETALEKVFYDLYDKLALHPKFSRLDKLTGIGRYGLLLLGLNDTPNIQDFARPVNGSALKLLWVKPFGEGSAPTNIIEYVTDSSDERYGQPLTYTITVANVSTGASQEIKVHHSRVIHVADGLLESEIEGTPRLQVVFNRLMDLEKLVGASAEMFWRGARPGYQGKLDENTFLSEAVKTELQAQIDEYEHNQRRMILNEGITWDALASQVADPEKHVLVQLQMISAVTGIPLRILLGSEVGELASSQDRNNWLDSIEGRRGEFAEPCIIRPFADRGIKQGWLPPPKKDYTVKWQDLFAMSDKEKADIGQARSLAIKNYASAPTAESIVPPKSFRTICLGLSDEENELIEEELKAAMAEEALLPEDELEPVPPDPNAPPAPANQVTTQSQQDPVDWKKVYEEQGAHWMDDLQPSQFAQEFAQKLVKEGKESLLEIGCANGRDSILFAIAGLQVKAIDLVPAAVEAAKQNAEQAGVSVDFQEGNAESLSFEDGAFDAVFSLSVLHSTDMNKSIPEVFRVLKSNGWASIYIYSDVQKIDGTSMEFMGVDEFIDLLKNIGFVINNFYTVQDEEYDEAGEKHSIIVTEIQRP